MTGTTGAGRARRATTTIDRQRALRTVLALALSAALLAGCAGEGAPDETVAVKTEAEIDLGGAASEEPSTSTTAEDDDGFDGRPATPRPTATPTAPPPPPAQPPAEGRDRPSLDGLDDRSSVVRDLEIVEGEIPDDAILVDEDFDTTTPRVTPFETVDGEGGIGSIGGETFFYEIVPARAAAHVAAPVRDLPLPDSESLYLQGTHFVTSFAGLAAADRGYYCWAADGLDPLAGARYEALLSPDGRLQVVRYGDDGAPEALLIDEVYTPDPEDPEEPDTPAGTVIMGLLCRPDAEGRAQIAVRVEGDYYVTTDDGNHPPGGGAGLVVAGAGPSAPDTIATYGVLFVVDGDRVPFL